MDPAGLTIEPVEIHQARSKYRDNGQRDERRRWRSWEGSKRSSRIRLWANTAECPYACICSQPRNAHRCCAPRTRAARSTQSTTSTSTASSRSTSWSRVRRRPRALPGAARRKAPTPPQLPRSSQNHRPRRPDPRGFRSARDQLAAFATDLRADLTGEPPIVAAVSGCRERERPRFNRRRALTPIRPIR